MCMYVQLCACIAELMPWHKAHNLSGAIGFFHYCYVAIYAMACKGVLKWGEGGICVRKFKSFASLAIHT